MNLRGRELYILIFGGVATTITFYTFLVSGKAARGVSMTQLTGGPH